MEHITYLCIDYKCTIYEVAKTDSSNILGFNNFD
jgi:hypothetical protein